MITKYHTDISDEVMEKNIVRLTNQLWKLIPMRENKEDWLSHLNYLIVELAGLNELCSNTDEKFLILLSKLKGLQIEDTTFHVYRKTVFECISLLREMRL